MRIGVAIDNWKLPIFERLLSQAGYTFENKGALNSSGTLLLKVTTANLEALAGVVKAANTEAAKTGAPK